MLLKTLASFVAVGFFASAVSAAPSDSLGYAESGKNFKINRSSEIINGRAESLNKVLDGDKIEAAEKPVRIQTSTGNTVMVQGQSSAEFVSSDSLNVVSGDVLVAIAPDSALNVTIGDLMIAPIKAEKSEGAVAQHLVAVKRINEGRVVVTGFNQPLNVTSKDAAGQLAVIGDRDTMEFAKTDKGWVVVQADEPEGGSSEPSDEGSGEEEEDDEERRGAFWWFGTPLGLLAGAGLLIGGGLLIDDQLNDDDDKDDEDSRGPTSNISFGGAPFGGDDEEVPESEVFTFSFF